MNLIQHYVGGNLISGSSDKKGKVFNPATGEQKSEVILANKTDLNKAVDIAKKAFETWSMKPALQRARVMFKFKELIEKNSEEITELIVSEHGKVYEDAKGSLTRGLEVVEFACGIPQLFTADFTENVGTTVDSWSLRQPLGVCAAITPFNFPALVPMWLFPIAIACGNTFILKPSEKDPSCAMKLAELLQEAGLPKGVLNVVNGDKEVVDAILDHPSIKTFSFVGSTPVAQYVHEKASANGKRVQALGGAKNHAIVLEDASLEQTTNAIIGAAYGSAGERCMAISVVVVVEGVADELCKLLSEKASALKIGPGNEAENEMGPLITNDHKNKVIDYIQQGIDSGAKILLDGREHEMTNKPGFFLGPTLFDGVSPEMSIYKEEIFGPVLSVVRVENYEKAISLVDNHEFGNGTSIYTSDGEGARHFTTNTKIGMVGVNVPIPVPMAFHSFGGWKRSLFGDQHMHGPEGVRFYTKLKTVTSRWPSGVRSNPEFVMPTMK